jgi:small-conductance mechanosensitive channel
MNLFGASNVRAELLFILAGLIVFVAFFVAARLVAGRAARALRQRGIRHDVVVVGSRVIMVLVIGIGALVGFGFALQTGNVALAGILIATIVASFGVQDLLKDYVSGYYVLFERHFRIGDRISLEGVGSGTVTDVKLRVTLLETDTGDLVVVPNSELFGKPVTVHARAAERAAEAGASRSEPPA